ncbi:MAG TPA: hypothetical protein PLP88_02010, partial [Bacteroidales bacterium]|nr:hypothetical protein [Bacteroidales bacterium]
VIEAPHIVTSADTPVLPANAFAGEANIIVSAANAPVSGAGIFAVKTAAFVSGTEVPDNGTSRFDKVVSRFVSKTNTFEFETDSFVIGTSFSDPEFSSPVSGTGSFVHNAHTIVHEADAFVPASSLFDKAKSVIVRIKDSFVLIYQRMIANIAGFADTISNSEYYYDDIEYVSSAAGSAAYVSRGKRKLFFPDERDLVLVIRRIEKDRGYFKLIDLDELFTYYCPDAIPKKIVRRLFWRLREFKPDYHYIPDQRNYTFRLLGKPSAGPSPPCENHLRPAA